MFVTGERLSDEFYNVKMKLNVECRYRIFHAHNITNVYGNNNDLMMVGKCDYIVSEAHQMLT